MKVLMRTQNLERSYKKPLSKMTREINSKSYLKNLSQSFKEEEKSLLLKGINSWSSLKDLKDEDINEIVKNSLSTSRNLRRLRCLAILINDLELRSEEAALLMHSGIATVKALAALTPQELLTSTGRLERLLNTGREPVVDLKKAHSWIQKAKTRQIKN